MAALPPALSSPPRSLDHEALWFGVSLAATAVCAGWILGGLPFPGCLFHAVSGWPCPGCGSTRAVLALARGDLGLAVWWNPLTVAALLGALLFNLYAGAVLLLKLPRLRFTVHSSGVATALRVLVAALILANWLYLIRTGI